MLKLGVVTRRGLRRPRTWFGRPRNVSFLLLQDLMRDAAATPEEYDSLAWYAPMPNAVWKLTRHGRLLAVDAVLSELVRERFPAGSFLTVCDLAASTGATSLELYHELRRTFAVDFIATDLYRDVVAIRSRRWPAAIVFDTQGHDVQYVVGPFVLPSAPPESAVYPVNRALRRIVGSWLVPRVRQVLARVDVEHLRPFEEVVVDSYGIVRLPVLTRVVLQTIASCTDFRFEAWDIRDRLPLRAHVVRAMNILGREHLAEQDRRCALQNCVEALHPGGLLVVGSSPSPHAAAVAATVYCARDGALTRLRTVGGGSEIDDLVASMFPVSDAQGRGRAA